MWHVSQIRFRPFALLLIAVWSLFALGAELARAQEPVLTSAPAPIAGDALRNFPYPNALTANGTAPLIDGTHREPIAPGSAAEVVVRFRQAAYGTIDGVAVAAVVLTTNAGGSGTFSDLHLIGHDGAGALTHQAQRLLGDRIRLQDLRIARDTIRLHFTGHAPNDGLCCPSLNVAQEYALEDGALRLVRARQSPALLPVPAGPSLIGWYGAPTTSTAILGSGRARSPSTSAPA